MRHRRVGLLVMAACGAALLSSLGCAIAADVFSPAIFASFGLDPASISGGGGTVIVSFTNNTTFPATFLAFESEDASNLATDSRNFSVEVEAGETRNEVLTCPVEVISPGSLDASFAIDALAANVTTDGGTETAEYGGAALIEGLDYSCGALIDIQLFPPTGALAAYQLTVRVVPGQ